MTSGRRVVAVGEEREPGMPRYQPRGLGIVWLIPAAVVVATILAILCGALWR
jgi:hypothetical protein